VQLENKISSETKKCRFAFPESVAEHGLSLFCKLYKLDEMSDIQCMGCRGGSTKGVQKWDRIIIIIVIIIVMHLDDLCVWRIMSYRCYCRGWFLRFL
jgi:hypothetical protein